MTTSLKHIMDTMDYGSAPENDDDARTWIESYQSTFKLFIDGEWTASQNNAIFETVNPANGRRLASVSTSSEADIDSAYRAARAAQDGWRGIGGFERATYLYAIARHIQKNARLFSVLETLDNGKPIRESRDIDIPLVIRHFYYHAGCAKLMDSRYAGYNPLGVVGQIVPWNFPLLMLAWKVAPALATGNTLVLKPAEQTSLTALLFAEICRAVHLPKGVVNIITGDGDVGKRLVAHPGFDKFAFTGSTAVGREIMLSLAGSGKPLTLELGGKSPVIIFENADPDSAVEGIVDGGWFNQGQVCCAGTRLLLQESIAERFIQKLVRKMNTLRIGNPLEKNIDMGAIVSERQKKRIDAIVQNSAGDCGKLHQSPCSLPETGFYYPPTLLENAGTSTPAFTEEIFGPVLVSTTFRTHDEAVALANNTRYGLSAGVWSEDINQALGIVPDLHAGVVWVNCANMFDASSEFGGVKETGYGREGGSGGLRAYMTHKTPPFSPGATPMPSNPTPECDTAETPVGIDQTQKLFIGGKQVRPDGGYNRRIYADDGTLAGLTARGNRKDIRNAVEAAKKASGWKKTTTGLRSQIIYFIAENVSRRKAEFIVRLTSINGESPERAEKTVDATIRNTFAFAAWADQYEGNVHRPPIRGLSLSIPEPVGIIGIITPDDSPLLAAVTMAMSAIAMGNRVVLVASERNPLCMTDFYQILETSDVPPGVINIVTGLRSELIPDLAGHYGVDSVWCPGGREDARTVELAAAGNLKRTFCGYGKRIDWECADIEEGLLAQATEIKTVWIPYGE